MIVVNVIRRQWQEIIRDVLCCSIYSIIMPIDSEQFLPSSFLRSNCNFSNFRFPFFVEERKRYAQTSPCILICACKKPFPVNALKAAKGEMFMNLVEVCINDFLNGIKRCYLCMWLCPELWIDIHIPRLNERNLTKDLRQIYVTRSVFLMCLN